MEELAIGIDLGTSTSEIAIFQHGEPILIPDPKTKTPIIPSLVALDKRSKVVVGEDARAWVDISGQGVREVKRLMGTSEKVCLGDSDYRPEEISAMILTKLKRNAEISLGRSVSELVISVPANFPDAARQATINAGEMAGLKVLRIINEPTAAAIAYGVNNIDLEAQLIVFDFGGGTLDITVMEMIAGVLDVKCAFGDGHLGGKDFDNVMIALIENKLKSKYPNEHLTDRQRSSLKGLAEKAKVDLSEADICDISLPGAEFDLEVDITRGEFEIAVAPLLERARLCLLQALKVGNIRPSAIDKVLLVGGTTCMPCVRRLVSETLGKEPESGLSPDLAVALGAASVAAEIMGLIDPTKGIVTTDVCEYGMGLEVIGEYGGRILLTYDELIPPNKPTPFSITKQYSLVSPDQREVEIHLYQNHNGKARLIEEAIDTGISGRMVDIPPALYGTPHPIEVEFSCDSNQTIKLRASIPGLGKSVEIAYDYNAARMTPEELDRGRWNLQELMDSEEFLPSDSEVNLLPQNDDWKKHPDARQYEPLISKAERLIDEVPEHRDALDAASAELKRSLSAGDIEEVRVAGDKLTDLLFDLDSAV